MNPIKFLREFPNDVLTIIGRGLSGLYGLKNKKNQRNPCHPRPIKTKLLLKYIICDHFKFLNQIVSSSRTKLLWLALCIGLSSALVQADGPNRVGLVVVHGDGQVIKQCIEFSEDEINGYEILKKSGLDLSADVTSSMGAAICSIDNEGCTFPQDKCFCQCQGSPCVYWSYWYLNGDKWDYSGFGAANRSVSDGDVEGWVWGEGTTSSASPPPVIPFDDICQTLPPTTTPTSSPTPTHTPKPTHTPEPTDTPTPVATPVIHRFTADRLSISAGQQVVLSWDLSEAEAAYLQFNGTQEGVIAPGSKTVAPTTTTAYTLVARNEGGQAVSEIVITVNAPAPTPTPTDPPLAAAAQPASDSASPSPTPTPVPEPDINFSAGALTLPIGACTSLYWEVQNASAVYLNEVEVDPQGAQEVCPTETQNYTLRAHYSGGERTSRLQLAVVESNVSPAPSPTATAPPTSTPTQASTLNVATATPAEIALAPESDATGRQNSADSERRHFTVSTSQEEGRADKLKRFVLYGGVLAAIFLFLVLPAAMLLVGWVAWWWRGRQ